MQNMQRLLSVPAFKEFPDEDFSLLKKIYNKENIVLDDDVPHSFSKTELNNFQCGKIM